jgi:hypothetical protein
MFKLNTVRSIKEKLNKINYEYELSQKKHADEIFKLE